MNSNMDIINQEKKYPTLVEVVNNPNNPTKTEVTNIPIVETSGQPYVLVRLGGGVTLQAMRPQSSYFNVCLDNILLLKGDGTFSPIPLNSTFTNMTNTNINNLLASYKAAYSVLVASVAAATLHYSKMNSTGVVTSEVYDLKD